ncbi:MAG: peptidoglycan D,D-transpeptidase FtsI family protein [Alphaproteobacteria bacterium]
MVKRPNFKDPLTIWKPFKAKAQLAHILETAHTRLVLLGVLFVGIFGGICWRLVDLGIRSSSMEETACLNKSFSLPRNDFVDRKGQLLATSLKTFSLYADPKVILNISEATSQIRKLFPHLNAESLKQKLASPKRFVWIARHLTPGLYQKVLHLGVPGLYVIKDQKRVYPHGSLFSHVLGLTSVDHHGLSGLEKGMQPLLQQQDAPVRLSVDVRLQHVMWEEIQAAIDAFQAKGGNGVLVKVKTGEVLAMVSLPDFDLNKPSQANVDAFFNRNTTGVYEFGSILKIHNTAMVLENGIANLNSHYDASCPLPVGRFLVTDFKGKNRPLSVLEAFIFSSNIANAKMALHAGAQAQRAFFKKLGFFEPVKIELPETGAPLVPSMQMWREPTVITASYGYGISVTSLHIAQSIAAILDGHKRPLTFSLVTDPCNVPAEQVVSEKTALAMRHLLRLAVLEGQAKKAAVEGYAVGGKTGTANLKEKGRYRQKNNLTSFVGAFPIDDPEYILLVTLDRPQPNSSTYGYATAGWIAAPLGAKIIERCVSLLGLAPESEAIGPKLPNLYEAAAAPDAPLRDVNFIIQANALEDEALD